MKCYTVNLNKVINTVSPIPKDMVSEGIDGKMRPDGKVPQMFLGQPGRGFVQYVDAAFMDGAEMVNNKFMSAGLKTARVGNTEKWFLTKPEGKDKSTNILVRIVGKTQRDLGLIIGGFTDGVEPIATGTGWEQSGNEWCDTLVVIPPYAAIFIAKGENDIIAIVNTGGGFLRKDLEPAPIAITPDEYRAYFLPHMAATLVDPNDAPTKTVTAPEVESTPAVTQTKTAPAPAKAPAKKKPVYANSPKQPKPATKTKKVEVKQEQVAKDEAPVHA